MDRRRITLVIAAILAAIVLAPALPAPSEADQLPGGWFVYTPNHPQGCAPIPYDCFIIFVGP